MPQLDILSWFNQVFSTLIVFFFFYLFLTAFFLPKLAVTQKLRFKFLNLREVIINVFSTLIINFSVDKKNMLSRVLFNNLNVINVFSQSAFEKQLVNSLTQNCYSKGQTYLVELHIQKTLSSENFLTEGTFTA
jgi:hypothetical protein